MRRHIHFDHIDRRAKSKNDNYGLNPHLGAGCYLNACDFNITPYGEIDYYFVQQNSFREHGADSLDLHVKCNQSNLLRVEIGVSFSKFVTFCEGRLMPSATISYVAHKVLSGDRYKSSFKGIDADFGVYGTKRCFNQLELGAGLQYVINNELALNAWYDAELGSKRQETGVQCVNQLQLLDAASSKVAKSIMWS